MSELEKRLRELHKQVCGCYGSHKLTGCDIDRDLRAAARIGAEFEREECAVALEKRGGCFYGNCAEAARGIRARSGK